MRAPECARWLGRRLARLPRCFSPACLRPLALPADMPRSKPLWGRFAAEPGGGISLYMIAVWKQEGYLQHWAQVRAGVGSQTLL